MQRVVTVRMSEELHTLLWLAGRAFGPSINKICVSAIESRLRLWLESREHDPQLTNDLRNAAVAAGLFDVPCEVASDVG